MVLVLYEKETNDPGTIQMHACAEFCNSIARMFKEFRVGVLKEKQEFR